MTFLIVLTILELAFIYLFIRKSDWLSAFIICNLLCITLFARQIVPVFGFETNVGNAPYAAVMIAQYVLYKKHGYLYCSGVITKTLFLLGFFVVTAHLVVYSSPPFTPFRDINEEIVSSIAQNLPTTMIAFFFSQSIMLMAAERLHVKSLFTKSFIAISMGQAADTLLFFLVLFSKEPVEKILEYMAAGMIIKTIMTLLGCIMIYCMVEKAKVLSIKRIHINTQKFKAKE